MTVHSFANDVGTFLETIRPWVAPGALVGILGLLLSNQVANRRTRVDEFRATAESEKGIRDHYADEVKALRTRLTDQADRFRRERAEDLAQWKSDLDAVEKKHAACVKENDLLSEKVRALKDLVAGLQRIILQNSAAGVLALGEQVHPEVRAAAERVENLFSKGPKTAAKPRFPRSNK